MQQYCAFRVKQYVCAIPVGSVQEVVTEQPVRALPTGPPTVRGLINLRGHLLAAIDLAATIGLSPTGASEQGSRTPQVNIVVRCHGETFSLLVDDVLDICNIESTQLDRPPETLSRTLRSLVDATFDLAGELALILNIQQFGPSLLQDTPPKAYRTEEKLQEHTDRVSTSSFRTGQSNGTQYTNKDA